MDWLLRNHTKAFVPMLVRLLPLQVSAQVAKQTKLQVNIVTVPRGYHYDAEGVLRPPRDRVIEHNADDFPAITIDEVEKPTPHEASPSPVMQLNVVEDDGSGPRDA